MSVRLYVKDISILFVNKYEWKNTLLFYLIVFFRVFSFLQLSEFVTYIKKRVFFEGKKEGSYYPQYAP